MNDLLAEARKKAKDDLEKTLAELFKKEAQPTGNPGVDTKNHATESYS